MTTNPKAQKFRVRRTSTDGAPAAPSAQDEAPANSIEAIRAEGLSPRQLRLARRVAEKNGLTPASDHEAVQQLRSRGIDPFRRAAVVPARTPANADPGAVQLPQKLDSGKQSMPSTEIAPPVSPAEQRAQHISQIQKDIARRRRRKSFAMLGRLALFVLLPTVLVGYYYYQIATPLYSTKAEMVIQQSDLPAAAGGMAGMLSSSPLATIQDSVAVQGYLESRAAMLRLDEDHAFRDHFADDKVDFVHAISAEDTNEAAYRVYRQNVILGYDPTEGVIRMEVLATDPETSIRFARALISYAEQQVDELSVRLRSDQMKGAQARYDDAEQRRAEARDNLLRIQQQLEIFDPQSENTKVLAQISRFETEAEEKQLQLQALQANRRPNPARVAALQDDIARLQSAAAEQRERLTQGLNGGTSLAAKSAELRMAEADFKTRDLMVQTSLETLIEAQSQADRQVRYLETPVPPIAPDAATYPRRFENTIVAFLIFSGAYLMLSITAAILREQVSS